jgi:HK97 gp10 family phage protein
MTVSANIRRDMGSGLAQGLGFYGLAELKENLLRVYKDLSGPVLRGALMAGAQVFKAAIQNATPIGSDVYTYRYGNRTVHVRNKRARGQAKANVIIYERKSVIGTFGRYTPFAAAKAGLLAESEVPEPSLLIGYEKKNAFYMYWYEYGTMNVQQALTPVAYTTKTGKRRFRKKNVVVNWGVRQKKQPFFRATCDANMQPALDACIDYLKSNALRGAA